MTGHSDSPSPARDAAKEIRRYELFYDDDYDAPRMQRAEAGTYVRYDDHLKALSDSQRPLADWIQNKARHLRSCPQSMYYRHENESGETPACTCGLQQLRDSLEHP